MSSGPHALGNRGAFMDTRNSWAAQDLTSDFTDLNNMARFQQKQIQEKEQKLLQLYDQQQQRAYQVVQRGSAGSTGSTSQQHSITRTTTATHTSSTTQGGKVRQMFDERRQTTVKGIDRSYPLEPLDNKLKGKIGASNGHLPSKARQNNSVTRQAVTVQQITKASVNNSSNGKNPIISYQEEVSQKSFENENDAENSSPDRNEVHIEEIANDDAIERNRMLAKIHLMEYDANLRYRINNDLDNEQFPVDLMIDIPDKLPRKPIQKKKSQAEVRLEKFKNGNAKRSNATITTTVNRSDLKKRSVPMFPLPRTTSRIQKSSSPEPAGKRSLNPIAGTPISRSLPSSPIKNPDTVAKRTTTQNQRQPSPTTNSTPRSPAALHSTAPSTTNGVSSAVSPLRQMATKAKNLKGSTGTTSTSSTKNSPSTKGGSIISSSDALTACKICGRRFAQDRVSLHEKICVKSGQKKRKQFDAARHRVQGTELEVFAKIGTSSGRQAEGSLKAKKSEVKAKSNWRRKHEDFINAIRSAKQVQAHLAAGGKLSDLPPPPASDTSDYIQCSHCGRKFNQGAAERHIPKCKTMMHNKPNPRAPPRPKR